MTAIQPNHRPVEQIERDLSTLRYEASILSLPDLTPLEKELQRLTTVTLLDPTRHGDLFDANRRLEDAKQVWADKAALNTRIGDLELELQLAQSAKRLELSTRANQRLSDAISAYRASALQTARLLRDLLNQQHRSAQVPGADSNLNHLRLDKFHIPHLLNFSWQGTLGQNMQQGTLPWEANDE